DMERSFLSGIILLAGVALVAAALAVHAILMEPSVWTLALAAVGAALMVWGLVALRRDIGALLHRRRTEIALYALGMVGVLMVVAYLSALYPLRFDLTDEGLHSLSEQTVAMLERIDNPVHIVFFHDPLLRPTVELYELIAAQTPMVTVDFYDPMINPAQARMRGVQFAGTAVLESEGRTMQVHGSEEIDIGNAILRISQDANLRVCFLEGHGEADPFSTESHDHMEGEAGHSHGLGGKTIVHERHGMAKARSTLEALNYKVEKVSLLSGTDVLQDCAVLVVAGPKVPLLDAEITAVGDFLNANGNAFFLLDPFVQSGLEPVLRAHGVVVDDNIVIDEARHFWADVSSPAVTSYNHHQVTRQLPLTFYPGARSLSPTPRRVPGTSIMPIVNSSTNSYGETSPDRAGLDEADLPGPNTIMAIVSRRPVDPTSAEALQRMERQEEMQPIPALPPEEANGAASAMPTGRSRIAIVGDSDFATNSFFHILGNGTLFVNTVSYLAAQENLIGIEPRTYDLPRVNLTNRQMKGTLFLTIVLIPGILAVVGIGVWWKQR
ncbi:MAG: Gldg family protein, partial [Candidatus Tectomicrobia bacterium]|nr:Gldg family protein [Candidatus Tectomicrobia bacterium]